MRATVEGQEIELELRGPEGGPTLVFVHGLTTDRRLMIEGFERVFAHRPQWQRLYLDLPGHGASPAGASGASADALVACVAALVRQHAGPRPALVGHSYGGYLALGALRELTELSGVFLVSPIVEPDVALRTLPPQRFSVVDQTLEFADDEERQAFLAEASVHSNPVLEAFRGAVDPAHRATDRTFLAMVRARYAMSAPWSTALRGFGGPLHVVCGQDDYWAGYTDAVKLVDLARRCRLTVLPGCGHLLLIEAGDALRPLFGVWLDEVELALNPR